MNTFRRSIFEKPGTLPVLSTIILMTWFLCDLVTDPDLFARVAMGRLIDLAHQVPLQDPFAFTPKNKLWIDHEWFAGVVFYTFSQLGGDNGLFFLKILFVFLSLFIIEAGQRISSPKNKLNPYIFLFLTLSLSQVWVSTIRSQVFSYLFIPFFLYAFLRYRQSRRVFPLYMLIPIMAIWVNSHGGFVVGIGFFAGFILSIIIQEQKFPLQVCIPFFLTLGTTLLNPYPGLTYWEYILEAVQLERTEVYEWSALNPLSHTALLPNLVVLLLVTGIWKKRKNLDWFAIMVCALSIYEGYKHQRLIAIFLITAIMTASPYLSIAIQTIIKPIEKSIRPDELHKAASIICILGAVFCGGIFLKTTVPHGIQLDYSPYPQKALEWIRTNRNGGNVAVPFTPGSFALWRLYPDFLISVDGRYEELYPNSTMKITTDLYWGTSKERKHAVKTIQPDFILLEKGTMPFYEFSVYGPEWELIYGDDRWAIIGSGEKNIPVKKTSKIKSIWEPLF